MIAVPLIVLVVFIQPVVIDPLFNDREPLDRSPRSWWKTSKSSRKSILRHLQKQKEKWRHEATEHMLEAVREDWETWKKDGYV